MNKSNSHNKIKEEVPLVSITCITYNHEPYIRECLEGFFLQQTDFKYEILIYDDASTDKTADIIREYEKQYPGIIKPIYQTENQYSKGVRGIFAKYNFSRARGEYIAMCEGDDYWIDPLKLQKQIDFLKNNKSYSLVCSNYHTSKNKFEGNIKNREIFPYDILHHNPIGTLTVVFRSSLLKSYQPPTGLSMGDFPMWLQFVKVGRVMKLGDVTALYRILQDSASGRNDIDKTIKFLKDSLTVTEKYINNFSLSKRQIDSIYIERYAYYINALSKKGKEEALKGYFTLTGKIRQIEISSFKQIVSILLKQKN